MRLCVKRTSLVKSKFKWKGKKGRGGSDSPRKSFERGRDRERHHAVKQLSWGTPSPLQFGNNYQGRVRLCVKRTYLVKSKFKLRKEKIFLRREFILCVYGSVNLCILWRVEDTQSSSLRCFVERYTTRSERKKTDKFLSQKISESKRERFSNELINQK